MSGLSGKVDFNVKRPVGTKHLIVIAIKNMENIMCEILFKEKL